MDNHSDLYHKNLLAFGFVIRQGAARVRRRWYHESSANFDTIDNYEYDAAGRLLKTVEADNWFQCVYSYDAADRIARRTHAPVDASDPNPPTVYEFLYDAAGRMTLERSYYENYDDPDTESTFTYDDQGRVTACHKLYLNAEDSATGDYRFTYDAEGRLHTITETFSRGSSSVSTYDYDDQNRLILMYKHDSYGQSAATSYEYIVETPEGAVIVNKDFADGKQLAAQNAHMLSTEAGRETTIPAIPPAPVITFEHVDFTGDLTQLVAEQLATGKYRGRDDSAPSDWLERAWHALPASERPRLTDALHRALTHADPAVRSEAVRFFDGNSRLADPDRFLDLIEQHWDLFRGLCGPSDSPGTDRGRTLVQLAAGRATGARGARFRKSMAFDPEYGAWVLAALAEDDPDWVAEHMADLVAPALDPKGTRLTVLVYNLQQRPDALRRAVANLAAQQPALKERVAHTLRAEVNSAALQAELLTFGSWL